MSSGTALRRLKKEYAIIDKEPPPGVLIVRPLERNFLHAHFLLGGEAFYDTPYEGGCFHGVLQFPKEYPMKPPAVIMRTPSGRFQPDKKICFSLSDYHPELWNPMWNIGTILTGLVSFMNSNEITTGGVEASASVRRELARNSLRHVMRQDALAKAMFASELDDIVTERASNGNQWPPIRLPPKKQVQQKWVSGRTTRRGQRPPKTTTKAEANEEPIPESTTTVTASVRNMGNNTSKNKKKREKEKRKKLARSFLSSLREHTPQFLKSVLMALDGMHLDVAKYPTDHVCWRTETIEEYSDLVSALKSSDEVLLLVESEIGGRPIATFELLESIDCGNERMIGVVEIPAPKGGRQYKRGLEHVEFVVTGDNTNENVSTSPLSDKAQRSTLEEFMRIYGRINWNTKAIDKPLNPDVSLQIELEEFGVCTVKFHLYPLSKVIEYEKEQVMV